MLFLSARVNCDNEDNASTKMRHNKEEEEVHSLTTIFAEDLRLFFL